MNRIAMTIAPVVLIVLGVGLFPWSAYAVMLVFSSGYGDGLLIVGIDAALLVVGVVGLRHRPSN